MRKNLAIFFLFSKYAIKSTMQHRTGAVFFLCGKLLRFGLYFLFVSYLLGSTRTLAGFSMTETLVFFLTFNVVDTLAQLLFREVYRFRPLVVNGELDAILIKPYHPFLRILLGGVDILDLISIVLYIGLLLYYVAQLPAVTLAGIALYILLFINALVIATAFHIIVLAMGILTTEVDHAIMIYRDITRLGAFPIDMYGEPVRTFFTFVLPIGIMMSYPVKSLLGILGWQFALLGVAVGAILLLFSLTLWNIALKKYQSWGG
jgi:ABC-2 type transport system permease protein